MDSIFFKVRNGIILCPDDCRIETYLGFFFWCMIRLKNSINVILNQNLALFNYFNSSSSRIVRTSGEDYPETGHWRYRGAEKGSNLTECVRPNSYHQTTDLCHLDSGVFETFDIIGTDSGNEWEYTCFTRQLLQHHYDKLLKIKLQFKIY